MAKYNYSKYTAKDDYGVPSGWNWISNGAGSGDGAWYSSIAVDEARQTFNGVGRMFAMENEYLGAIGYRPYYTTCFKVIKRDGYYEEYTVNFSNMKKNIKIQGTYLNDVVAENGTYPTNGVHTDGYWYVRGNLVNNSPTIVVNTTDNRTLYENDTFSVSGNATDVNSGDVVNVKYQINNGTVRAITAAISTGAAIIFNKVLTFKNKALYDGSTAVTDTLAESTQHVLKVWAEDDQGGKSAEVIRIFYVIPNRPAALTINPFTLADKLINTDKITISGSVSDPDGNTVTVKYKIANGSFVDVYSGSGGNFSFQVLLSALVVGTNTITVQAVDSYGSVTSKTLSVNKAENRQPLLTSVVRYKLTPPNVTAKGIVLWIQREVGDLILDAEISMGATGTTENFVPMTKFSTAFVATGIEEDEFVYENATAVENIVLKLTMTRENVTSNEGIKLISGVLS